MTGWETLSDEGLIAALVRSEAMPEPRALERVCEHVAAAGYDPDSRVQIDRRLAGHEWRGRVLAVDDRLPAAEAHYLKHVVVQREWPEGMSEAEYRRSLLAMVRAPDTAILASRYSGHWHLTYLGASRLMRGVGGGEWIMLEYDVPEGHWVTAFQPEAGMSYVLASRRRGDMRWLREP